MDSVTQIVLGAAVGEAVLGTKMGRKGALWGAILGTLPDLDIIVAPFVDPVTQLAAHRAASHSLLVALIGAPLIGYGLSRLYKKYKVGAKGWILMSFLAWATHIGIDLCTVYGTQILWPISDYPYSFDSLFIIDPFYTVPLALGILISLAVKRSSRMRTRANIAGLLLSSMYLTWAAGAKLIAQGSFRLGLASNGRQTEMVMTAPSALNTVLWMGMGVKQDTLNIGLFSVLDRMPPTKFVQVPRNTALLEGHMEDRAVKRLMWFSKGWYAVEEDADGLTYSDFRFGRSDGWLSDHGDYVFRFRLLADSSGSYESFLPITPDMGDMFGTLNLVYERAKGK
jgi:inner membrane protein